MLAIFVDCVIDTELLVLFCVDTETLVFIVGAIFVAVCIGNLSVGIGLVLGNRL
jgi:hypothetical protein